MDGPLTEEKSMTCPPSRTFPEANSDAISSLERPTGSAKDAKDVRDTKADDWGGWEVKAFVAPTDNVTKPKAI